MKKLFLLVMTVMITSLVLPEISYGQGRIKLEKRDARGLFELLAEDTMYLVDDFYAPDVHFKDPIVEFNNREDLKSYYHSSYSGADSVSFEVPSIIDQGNEQVVIWVMTLTSRALSKGKPIIVEGSSYIKYNEQGEAIFHQDYFDMGTMIYTHVPFVGGMTRFVNTRMRKKHDPTFGAKKE